MTERAFNFRYENRDGSKMIPVTDLQVSKDGSISVKIDKEVFKSIFPDPDKAIKTYNRSVIHG